MDLRLVGNPIQKTGRKEGRCGHQRGADSGRSGKGMMKIIGIELSASDLKWVLLNGAKSGGNLEYMESNKLSLPKIGNTQVANLVSLKSQLLLAIKAAQPDQIAIIKSQTRGQYSASVDRIKMECIVELAAYELGIASILISGKSVDDAEKKKLVATIGTTIESAFCGGSQIAPKYLRKAAFAAWTCLP